MIHNGPSTVIVFGPTGKVGSAAARQAQQLGARVVLALRDPHKPIISNSKLNSFNDQRKARPSEPDDSPPTQMDAHPASPSWRPPSDPEEFRKLIDSVKQSGSSERGQEVLPPVPLDAPEILRKNWAKYVWTRHEAPGPLKIAKWNYDHPVVWMNGLLGVALTIVTVSQWDQLSMVSLGVYPMLLTFLD